MKQTNTIAISIVALLLSLMSLLVLFSIAPDKLPQQATFLLIGFVLFRYLAGQNTSLYKNTGPVLYATALIVLLATLLFGESVRGSTRWLNLFGTSIQTSELIKPLLIISYADFLTRWQPTTMKNIARNAVLAAIPILLIFVQPDLGTALVHTAIWIVMTIIAGLPLWAGAIGGVAIALATKLLPNILKEYQKQRLSAFLNPNTDPLGAGYNVIQSMIAIGSGRLFGKGLGRGTQSQLQFLPERQTDFIFASLAEEFGFLGAGAVIALYSYMLVLLLRAVTRHENMQGKLLATGAFTYLFFQGFLNIAMNLGIAPVTGITLPLVSAGGSSILATYAALGIATAVMNETAQEAEMEIK